MVKSWAGAAIVAAVSAGLASGAAAQAPWVPGSEIIGQSVQIETNGVANTVFFDAGGAARIVTPKGTPLPATWSAAGGQLCLQSGGASECWPYRAPFRAGQQMTLTSSCQVTSSWLPTATNAQEQLLPERG